MGSRGRAAGRFEQFISSGIAHPPPPPALARGYEWMARLTSRRAGMALSMRALLPDGRRYLAERNWLELTLHPDGRRDAVLHAEEAGAVALR